MIYSNVIIRLDVKVGFDLPPIKEIIVYNKPIKKTKHLVYYSQSHLAQLTRHSY